MLKKAWTKPSATEEEHRIIKFVLVKLENFREQAKENLKEVQSKQK